MSVSVPTDLEFAALEARVAALEAAPAANELNDFISVVHHDTNQSDLVFHNMINGVKTEVARFRTEATGKRKYLFIEIDAWEGANPGATYPQHANDFHFCIAEGQEGNRVDVEFESTNGDLRFEIESPPAFNLYMNFEHTGTVRSIGMPGNDAREKLIVNGGFGLTGSDILTMDCVNGRVYVNLPRTDNVIFSANEKFGVHGLTTLSRDNSNPLALRRTGNDGIMLNVVRESVSEGDIKVVSGVVSLTP